MGSLSDDRARSSNNEAAFRSKTLNAINLLICCLMLVSTGCVHKMPLDRRAFTLEGGADFPIMAPANAPSRNDSDFQDYELRLAGKGASTNPSRDLNCTIKGTVFSISPARSSDIRLWVVTSLNVQGWARRSDSTDVQSEWTRFAREVLALMHSGCFPRGESPQEVLKEISEAIPVPASEELLYNYSFGRAGVVDLVPGMQLVIERAFFQFKDGVRVPASPTNEFSERLAVVESRPRGSALHLLGVESRGLGKTLDNGADSPRSVPDRFGPYPRLRLIVLSLANDETRRFPVLMGSIATSDLWDASDKIVDRAITTCPPSYSSHVECMFFDRDSAVSVMMSIWVNGRHLYRPLTTTLGSLIGMLPESEANRALATVSLERPLVGGGYARVNFPHDARALARSFFSMEITSPGSDDGLTCE
jgi:hypothetical protein